MAEIEIEPRKRRNPWGWIVALLIVAALAIGAWLVLSGDPEPLDPGDAIERVIPDRTSPAPPAEAPDSGTAGTAPPAGGGLEPEGDSAPPIDPRPLDGGG